MTNLIRRRKSYFQKSKHCHPERSEGSCQTVSARMAGSFVISFLRMTGVEAGTACALCRGDHWSPIAPHTRPFGAGRPTMAGNQWSPLRFTKTCTPSDCHPNSDRTFVFTSHSIISQQAERACPFRLLLISSSPYPPETSNSFHPGTHTPRGNWTRYTPGT